MTNKYTIEELKEKIEAKFDESGIFYSGSYIDDDFDQILVCFDKAFKELIKEKLSLLTGFTPHFNRDCTNGIIDCEYFRIKDIEELFNIKLK